MINAIELESNVLMYWHIMIKFVNHVYYTNNMKTRPDVNITLGKAAQPRVYIYRGIIFHCQTKRHGKQAPFFWHGDMGRDVKTCYITWHRIWYTLVKCLRKTGTEKGREGERGGEKVKRLWDASFLLFDSCIVLMHWGSLDYISYVTKYSLSLI